jgi:hypothetical protein
MVGRAAEVWQCFESVKRPGAATLWFEQVLWSFPRRPASDVNLLKKTKTPCIVAVIELQLVAIE